MQADHAEAYKEWSIIVTVSPRVLVDTAVERFIPQVAIVQLQEAQQRFMGVARGAGFLDRCDAIREGIAAAKTFIDATVNGDDSTRIDAFGGLAHVQAGRTRVGEPRSFSRLGFVAGREPALLAIGLRAR